MNISRRSFFHVAGGAAAMTLVDSYASTAEPIRMAMIVPAEHAAVKQFQAGAAVGVQQAQKTAELKGRGLDLSEAVVKSPVQAATAARQLLADGAVCVFGGIRASYCAAIADAAPDSYLEVRARQDLSPNEPPLRHLAVNPGYQDHARTLVAGLCAIGIKRFAVISPNPVLSAAARSAGLEEVQEGDAEVLFTGRTTPDEDSLAAGILSSLAPGNAVPVAWHPSLRRYGATQLNDRFKTKTGHGMDENAWYGWFAVKLIAEASLRGNTLADCRTNGHKGVALSFVNRRIKQPLYVVVTRPKDRVAEVVDA